MEFGNETNDRHTNMAFCLWVKGYELMAKQNYGAESNKFNRYRIPLKNNFLAKVKRNNETKI